MRKIILVSILLIGGVVLSKMDFTQEKISTTYEKGREADKQGNSKEAERLYKLSCNNDNFKACDSLGFLYYMQSNKAFTKYGEKILNNEGKDFVLINKRIRLLDQARVEYRKACDGGFEMGCSNLDIIANLGKKQ